jgi:hypothetical protein
LTAMPVRDGHRIRRCIFRDFSRLRDERPPLRRDPPVGVIATPAADRRGWRMRDRSVERESARSRAGAETKRESDGGGVLLANRELSFVTRRRTSRAQALVSGVRSRPVEPVTSPTLTRAGPIRRNENPPDGATSCPDRSARRTTEREFDPRTQSTSAEPQRCLRGHVRKRRASTSERGIPDRQIRPVDPRFSQRARKARPRSTPARERDRAARIDAANRSARRSRPMIRLFSTD